ncbi:hypothetical protein ASC77_23405 [Nocardioides sp. Root1257]|nr:hypothetical protein ASC77_23405 [Nocardioides sp. Root1257]KRC39875.1 hypothetical protein ASE24_23200 [Nocardioides sp. Root224]
MDGFVNEVETLESDVIIATARKAVCLLDALRRSGRLRTNKPIVSDRVLDMDLGWLKGKSVGIVDELIISGSTLYHARNKLRPFASKVELRAAAVDSEWWNPTLVQPGGSYARMNHEGCLQFSRHVVLALGLLPRTYNLDWPLVELKATGAAEVQALIEMSGFDVAPAANRLQRESNIRSYTFEAESHIRSMLDESFDWHVSKAVDLLKVRVMLDRRQSRSRVLHAVPMAVLRRLPVADVNLMFDTVVAGLGYSPEAYAKDFKTPESRLRLVQHTIAARLGRIWLEQYNMHAGMRLPWRPSEVEAGYLFSPPTVGLAMNAARSIEPLFAKYHASSSRPRNERVEHKESLQLRPSSSTNRDLAQLQLTHPFLNMFQGKEQKARELLRDEGAKAFGNPRYKAILARLNAGVTVAQLGRLLERGQVGIDADERQRTISQFIDLAVDEGIAVPVTVQSGNSLVRAYRHGEDVTFGEREFYIAKMFFDQIFATAGDVELGRTDTEKFISILLRAGLENSVFEPFSGRLGHGRAGPRWDRHGVVARANSSTMFTNTDGERLSSVFLAKGVLKKGEKGRYAPGTMVPSDPVDQKHRSSVLFLAQTLGKVRYGRKPLLTSYELALFASCGRLPDLIKALAAEVHICLPLVEQFASTLRGKPTLRSAGARAISISGFEEASTSGIQKYDAYTSGLLTEIHSRVAKSLEKDLLEFETWNQLGSTLLGTERDTVDKQAERLAERLDGWVRVVTIASIFGTIAARLADGKGYHAELELIDETIANARTPRALGKLPAWWKSNRTRVAGRSIDPTELAKVAAETIDEHLPFGQQLLDEAAARCDHTGELRKIRTFQAALVIVEPGVSDQAQAGISDDLMRYIGNAVARVGNITKNARGISVPATIADEGALVVADGTDSATLLGDVAVDVLQYADENGHDIKLALVPLYLGHERLFHGRDNPEYYGHVFFDRTRALRHAMKDDARFPYRTLAIIEPPTQTQRTSSVIEHIGSQFRITGTADLDPLPATPGQSRRGIEAWTHTNVRIQTMARAKFDVGIITVKPVETRAMLDALRQHGPLDEFVHNDATIRTGHIKTKDGAILTAAVIQCLNPNSNSAAVALESLIAAAPPSIVALVGIAGGFRDKVELGDVIIATQIIDYDQRKTTPTGSEWSGVAHIVDARIKRALEDFQIEHGEPADLVSGNGAYQVHAEPLGTGGAVIADGEAIERERLEYFNRKTAGVETEAAGIAQSFYENTSRPGYPGGYLVVRGVSDFADETKDDSKHKVAAENAAHALVDLVSCGHVKPS